MSTKTFALIFGIAFLLIGASGFIPGMVTPGHETADHLVVEQGYGLAMGLFPVNILHNLVHVLFGVWGLLAYRSLRGSIAYARGVAIIYAVLAIMGFIPGLDTTFGLVPLYGNDIWLHVGLAIPAAYFGWVHRNNNAATERH